MGINLDKYSGSEINKDTTKVSDNLGDLIHKNASKRITENLKNSEIKY